MKDVAFRKGRNAFKNDEEYLRALHGEELEDESFEDEEDEPLDEEDEPLDEEDEPLDEEDEPLDEEDEPLDEEDEPLDEDEATRYWSDFESFLDDLLTDGSANAINRLFDWVIEYDAGNRNIGISVEHGGTTLHLQPDVDDDAPYELKFKLSREGEEDMTGGYDFTGLVAYLEQIVDEEDSPFVNICNMVDNELTTADFHGDLGGVWRGDIAEHLAHMPTKAEVECNLFLKSMDGEDEDAHLEFRRKPHLPDGDTTWVFDGEPSKEHSGKGCPTVLLRWLLDNHKGLL
jgi:hypothetical protein